MSGGGGALKRRTEPPPLRRDQALFLDFDGTLVEIAPAPSLVRVPAELPQLLGELADWLGGAVAVVSGRPLDELARMIDPFVGPVAGQHGLERRHGDGSVTRCPVSPKLAEIRSVLAKFAARYDGVVLEEKGGSVALHYRQAPTARESCETLIRRLALESDGAFEALDGKMVTELRPRSGGKGRAITEFLAEAPFRGRVPVFIGDDTTDEDGFAAVNQLGGISIHVGGGTTIARHNLATVGDVWAWLARGSPNKSRGHKARDWCSEQRIGQTATATGREQGVAQQASDRHRPDPARHRRDRASDGEHGIKINVADDAAAAVR